MKRKGVSWIQDACLAASLFLMQPGPVQASATWDTLVSGDSFNCASAFESSWNYNYPWGTNHNGSAVMNATNITVSGGTVTLTSSLTNKYEGVSTANPHLTIRYNSGTFYLKQEITISPQYPVWDISGQFKAPTLTGTWPAFWLTGAHGWPPESDVMEFKGNSSCLQNTYNGRWQVHTTTIPTADTAWHTYRVVACLENSNRVDFHYYIDGAMESEQTSTTFAGRPCWLIIDFQMEGSSGAPGPSFTTYTYASNIVVRRLNVSGVGAGPIANGAWKIVAQSTGEALGLGNQATANNSSLDQSPYNAGLNQQWTLAHLGSSQYAIFGRQSGRALQVAGAAKTDGASVNIADYTNGNNQKWTMVSNANGSYGLVNAGSGKLLSFDAGSNQQWTFQSP
ncbi:MAG: RICIN domain-containing protein [Verrucomicrobiota bacterium]|jgi:hypothetical protein